MNTDRWVRVMEHQADKSQPRSAPRTDVVPRLGGSAPALNHHLMQVGTPVRPLGKAESQHQKVSNLPTAEATPRSRHAPAVGTS